MDIKKIITHGGVFHADDVMCVALARYINPDVRVERVFQAPETVEDGEIVADIGFGRYDHHQEDARVRAESGEKYAACGLLLEDVWQDIFPDEASYKKFVRDFIIPIELADNGVATNPLSLAVSSFVPTWDSEESMDEAFYKALDFVSTILDRVAAKDDYSGEPYIGERVDGISWSMEDHFPTGDESDKFREVFVRPLMKGDGFNSSLDAGEKLWYMVMKHIPAAEFGDVFAGLCQREIDRECARVRAEEIVRQALEKSDGNVVILPRFCPWQEVLCPSTAKFVVFPSNRGGYNLQVVPVSPDSFEAKQALPVSWLEEKPEECTFVHPGRFLAAFDTLEQAVAAASAI